MEKASQLVILKDEQIVYSLLMNKKELVQVNVEQASLDSTLLGNIYIGKVKNIVKNINAAFVEISGGRMCYLPLSKPQYVLIIVMARRETIYASGMKLWCR